jgi:hypothetical protein
MVATLGHHFFRHQNWAVKPFSMALLGFQGDQILSQPLIIVMLAVPILIQVYFNSGLAYVIKSGSACGALRCGTFGIVLFGCDSAAALATFLAVLVEMPVIVIRGENCNQHTCLVRARWCGSRLMTD